MKKIISLFMATFFLFGLVSCAAPEEKELETETSTVEEVYTKTEEKKEEKKTEGKKEEKNTQTLKIPYVEKKCQVPADYSVTREGYVTFAMGENGGISAVCYSNKKDFTGTEEDILAYYAKHCIDGVGSYLYGKIDYDDLKASSTKKVEVAGQKAVCFEGKVPTSQNFEAEIYGYSMMIDNTPVMFITIMSVEKPTTALMDELKAVVDQMVETIA